MTEDVIKEALRLLVASGVGLPVVFVVIAVLAVVLVVGRRIKLPPAPPPSPDLVENPPSPGIPLNPDGSIPTSNPVVPPDPLP